MLKNDVQIKSLLQEIKHNSNKKVLVYSLDGCPACEELKEKMDKLGIVYENVEMSGNDSMWDKLKEMGGSEYVPQVKVAFNLIKEDEYETVDELLGKTISNIVGRKIVIK